MHIIKTTASIPTKFCIGIKNTKCPSWVVPTHALQIQDGGRPPSWKNRKIVICQPRFERFWRNLARWCSLTLLTVPTVKNLKFQKSKMAAAAILKNRKIAISRSRFNRFWRNLAFWCSSSLLTVPTVKNVKFQKSKTVAAAILKNQKLTYLRRGLGDFDKIWHSDAVHPSWPFGSLKCKSLKIQDGGCHHL